ncbi:hypothetical protein [Massilia niastensis]|uniref:hypothetical protein n=1 Tax=Massilia niastensis TaxID=544911 RepID=UPI0012EC81C9|nr:hypothetical protein [Massilia niastensis]
MKLILLSALFLASVNGHASQPEKKAATTFLTCSGTMPYWTDGWGLPAQGLDNSNATMTIKLSDNGKKARALFVNLGEQEFDLKTSDEFYSSWKTVSLSVLDGRVIDINLSINRITGSTNVLFTVADSPKDGGRYAFSGHCKPAKAKF